MSFSSGPGVRHQLGWQKVTVTMAVMSAQMRANVDKLLRSLDRYDPENSATLEHRPRRQNAYDLEANLAILKSYQFSLAFFQSTVPAQTSLPHTGFTLCKCMTDQAHQEKLPSDRSCTSGNY